MIFLFYLLLLIFNFIDAILIHYMNNIKWLKVLNQINKYITYPILLYSIIYLIFVIFKAEGIYGTNIKIIIIFLIVIVILHNVFKILVNHVFINDNFGYIIQISLSAILFIMVVMICYLQLLFQL